MAAEFPTFIVMRSTFTGQGFVRYVKDNEQRRGYLRGDEVSVLNPICKIEVERSKTDHTRYVHFRFVHVNKYWARPANNRFLIASSDQPEEDLSKPTCTLFEVVSWHADGRFALRHSQTNFMINNSGSDNFLVAENTTSRLFTFVDWDTLVALPKYVAFKAHNDRYVGGLWIHNGAYLQPSEDDPNHNNSCYEIQQMPDGHVRIKSVRFDRYWRRSLHWILANATHNDTNINTLFWPVLIDDNTIALRSAGNNNFIRPLTGDSLVDCLNAESPNITRNTRFVVEESVLRRDIYNVRYRMEDARIYDEEPFLAGIATATNFSNEESSLAITVAYEESFSYSFTNSDSITAGVESKIRVGIPKIASGQIRVSSEVTKTFEWNRTEEEKKTVTAEHTLTVPPKSRARVSYVGTQGKCSVPFNYTRRDKMSTNGQMITIQNIDGIYNGVNYYNFQFEVMEIEPL